MMRAAALLFAGTLWVIPFSIAPLKPVAVVGTLGVTLAAAGVVGLWRWPLTAAACVFLIDYTAALWIMRPSPNMGGALAFGLALLLLPASVELGRGVRRARVEGRLVRSQLAAWSGFATAVLAATLLGLALAGGVAGAIPFGAAPFVAGLAALGIVLALTTIVAGRRRV